MGRCNSSVIVLHFTLLLHYYYTTFEKTKKHGATTGITTRHTKITLDQTRDSRLNRTRRPQNIFAADS